MRYTKSLRNNYGERREILLGAPAGRVVAVKGTVESEVERQEKREEIPLEAQFGGEDTVKGKMRHEWTTLESSRSQAGTGVKAPEQSHLSCGEMLLTTVDGCRLADGRGSAQGVSIISSSRYRAETRRNKKSSRPSPNCHGADRVDTRISVWRGSYFFWKATHITARQLRL